MTRVADETPCRRLCARAASRRALAALALVASIVFGASASVVARPAERMITAAQAQEDLRVLRGALVESHAGLYWFTSKRRLDRSFRAVSDGLTESTSVRDFHRSLLPLVASIRHGHTTVTSAGEGVGYRLRQLDPERAYLPFELRILRDRLYVVTDLSDETGIAAGSEILAIDGRPTSALLATMRRYVSADGANDTYKTFQLERNYQFLYLLELLYGPSERFTVRFRPLSGGPSVRRSVAAVPPRRLAERYRERAGRDIDAYPPALELRMLGERVALLRVSSFYEGLLRPGEPGFEAFFASAFAEIKEKGVEDLIVDVRGNEGGNGSYVPLLYSYLADRAFRLATPTTLASASMSYLAYDPNPSEDVRAFAADPLGFVSRAPNGEWILKEEIDKDRYTIYEPRPDRFAGNLYVLTDGGSFSATNEFVDLVYRYRGCTARTVRFVGEQNGGDDTFGRVSGGQTLRVVLPNSKETVSIPLLGFRQHFAEASPKAVIPDDLVRPSIRDVLSGADREVLFVEASVARRRERARRARA